jgi:hypothetical protein
MRNLRLFDAGEQFVKGTSGGAGRIGAKDCIVEHCLIEYTDIGPIANKGYTQGVDIHRGDRNIVRDCVFRNMHVKPGLRFQHGPAVLMWNDTRDSIVERCVFLDCDRGVQFGVNPKPKTAPATTPAASFGTTSSTPHAASPMPTRRFWPGTHPAPESCTTPS